MSHNGLMLKMDLMGGPMDGDSFVTAFHGRDEYKLTHRDRSYKLVYRVVGPHLPFPEHIMHNQPWASIAWGGEDDAPYGSKPERFVPPTTVAVFAGYEDLPQKRGGTEAVMFLPPVTDDNDDRCDCGCEDDDE